MGDLRNLQREINDSYAEATGVQTTITDGYPSYYGFRGGFLLSTTESEEDQILYGGFIDYTSTGGRIDYQDYSGMLRVDQIVSAWSFGPTAIYRKSYSELFCINYETSIQLVQSQLHNVFNLRIGSSSKNQIADFHSLSFGIEPSIQPSLKFLGCMAGISLSYLFFLPTSLEYDNYSDAYLVNKNGDRVTIDWGGFKFGLSAEFSF